MANWSEITQQAEERHREWEKKVVRIPDMTLETLKPEMLGQFEHGTLYEFLPHRENPGGEILFECEKEAGKTYFEERFRIYRPGDIQGIEVREDPTYRNGLCQSLYLRTEQDSSLLDMGCGTAKYLLQLNDTDRKVLAFDLSRDLIEENKCSEELDRISFFTGNCLDLDYIPDREFDYVTGVNLSNVLPPESVKKVIEESRRVAKKGILFGYTLPSQCDLWTEMTPRQAREIVEGIGNPDAAESIQELAAKQAFLGQMNMFRFFQDICRQKGWPMRIFLFLDKTTMNRSGFPDSRMLYPEENGVMKFLELPLRKISKIEEVSLEQVAVHAVGYGLEIAFSKEEQLEKAESLLYFSDDQDLSTISIESEMDRAIDFWGLPFQKSL